MSTLIGQASMHTPQFGQEYTCTRANPLRAFRTFSPAFRIGMSIISAGMCMYRVKGSTDMNTPSAME